MRSLLTIETLILVVFSITFWFLAKTLTQGEPRLVLEDFEPDDEIFIMTDDCPCMRYHDFDYCICDEPGA